MFVKSESFVWNTFIDLVEFFERDAEPLSDWEFILFWESLSLDEQWYYRTVNLWGE